MCLNKVSKRSGFEVLGLKTASYDLQVLSFGTTVNGNAMTSGVGHTVRSNGFGRAI